MPENPSSNKVSTFIDPDTGEESYYDYERGEYINPFDEYVEDSDDE